MNRATCDAVAAAADRCEEWMGWSHHFEDAGDTQAASFFRDLAAIEAEHASQLVGSL